MLVKMRRDATPDDPRLAPYLAPATVSNLRRSFPKRDALRAGLTYAEATVHQLDSLGVPILAGTDAPNPGTAHGASLHRELELLVASGLTPAEALAAATATPARVFKLEDRGRIEEEPADQVKTATTTEKSRPRPRWFSE